MPCSAAIEPPCPRDQAQDGVVHAFVPGCRTDHVDVQVADGQVAEDEVARIAVHARDRRFDRLDERCQAPERQPDIELLGDANGRDGLGHALAQRP